MSRAARSRQSSRVVAMSLLALGLASCTSERRADGEDHRATTDLLETKWIATGGGTWSFEEGLVRGTSSATETDHGLLMTTRSYRDFELTFEYLLREGNSGFYFRSEPEPDHPVGIRGFQVEVDEAKPGGLYETLGREWVVLVPDADARRWHRKDWNRVSLSAIGDRVRVTLNGHEIVEIIDPKGRDEGVFAMQLHGGQEMDVSFRNLRIREID